MFQVELVHKGCGGKVKTEKFIPYWSCDKCKCLLTSSEIIRVKRVMT